MNSREFDCFFAKLRDLHKRATRGDLGISAFFSPKELYYATEFLRREGCVFLSFGGYSSAERKRVYILPEYMSELKSANELSKYGFDVQIAALEIKGSGYEKLSHRDFMGAVLGLGVERGIIGDIIVFDEQKAIVFCDAAMLPFLSRELNSVGRDKVTVEPITLEDDFDVKRCYSPICDTVASARLDAVVGALCSVSREKAKELVLSGFVELDYSTEERIDREVKNGSIISVTGYGKFRIISVDDKTRKGRYRLVGEKYL